MSAAYATSPDGLDWSWHGTVLRGRPGRLDARGARLTVVLSAAAPRTTAAPALRRTGSSAPASPTWDGTRVHTGAEPVADVRYLEVVPLPGGAHRIYCEARLPDREP